MRRKTEQVVKSVAFELIALVPDNGDDVNKQKDSIDKSLTDTISAWSGGVNLGISIKIWWRGNYALSEIVQQAKDVIGDSRGYMRY